jgi:hypothetical protein
MPLSLTSTLTDIISAFVNLDSGHPIGSAQVVQYAKGIKLFWPDTSRVLLDLSTMSVTANGVRLISPPAVDIPGGFNPNSPVDSSGTSTGGTLTLKDFSPFAGYPPAVNPASANTVNAIPSQDFLNGVINSIFFAGTVPQGLSWTTGLKVILKWAGVPATGNVMWGAAFEPTEGANVSSDHWGVQVTATGASAGANIETSTSISVPAANLGTLASDQLFRLQISRVGTNAGDTMAGIAHLLAVAVEAY